MLMIQTWGRAMDEEAYRLALELRNRLQAELAQNETFRAFQHIDAVVAMWEKSRDPATARPIAETVPKIIPPVPTKVASVVGRHFAGSQTYKIVTGAQDYLRRKGSRAPASEIHKDLISKGIAVGGKNPLKVTASYLSHSPYFNNVPGQGYGLIEWSVSESQKTEAPGSSELSGAPQSNGASPLSP
jgi:hypothetical protein